MSKVVSFILITFFLLVIIRPTTLAQQLSLPLNTEYSSEVQKALYSPSIRFHTSVRPFVVKEVKEVCKLDSLVNSRHLLFENSSKWKQKALTKLFNSDLVEVRGKDFSLQINPLLQFEAGKDLHDKRSTWINTRGLEVKGNLGTNFSFYTTFRENQAVFPSYLDAYIRKNRVVPGQGMVKNFGSDGFDYAYSTAYLSYAAGTWFNVQFGYNKNFLGDGYRSLLLSDAAFPYPNLKITGRVWNLTYVAHYSQYIDIQRFNSPSNGYARKYVSSHYLSWQITNRFNLSLFDAVVWKSVDSAGMFRGFDLQYLNPIIFLRPVEFSVGSPDNALLGLTTSYKLGKRTTFYGQLALDEFKIDEIRAGNGWWANKYAFQAGLKAFDAFGIPKLYLQTEYNWVRPFMYSHYEPLDNYGHYNQPLAHPWGANFWESVSFLTYNIDRFYLHYKLQFGLFGDDTEGFNYGHNIYLDYDTRVNDYGNTVGQGISTSVLLNDITFSWLINPAYNLNLYAGITQRRLSSEVKTDKALILRIGLRTSLENLYNDL